MMLLEPKELELDGKTFILSKFPAVAGREIITQYVPTAMPKAGDYQSNETIMLKLMAYVAVRDPASGVETRLQTRALVDNHVGSWETLMRLEVAMMEYNCSFFADGRASAFFEGIAQKAPQFLQQTLTPLLQQLWQKAKQT